MITKEFILRPLAIKDAQAYLEMHQDKEAKRNFMRVPKNIEEARKELQENLNDMKGKKPTKEWFAIEINGECAGFIWIDDISYGYQKHQASIGFGIIKKFRGHGIGTKAIKLVTDYAFKKYKLKRIATFTRIFNKGSRKAMEKSGYKLEGILRKNKFKDGKYLDDCLYAKVK